MDYLVRLRAHRDRAAFFRRNIFDLLVLALPLPRPLRLLRLVMLLRVVNRKASTGLRGKVAAYVVGVSGLLAFVGALAAGGGKRPRLYQWVRVALRPLVGLLRAALRISGWRSTVSSLGCLASVMTFPANLRPPCGGPQSAAAW